MKVNALFCFICLSQYNDIQQDVTFLQEFVNGKQLLSGCITIYPKKGTAEMDSNCDMALL